MDWGLGSLSSDYLLLRSTDTLAFEPYIYYSAIIVNIIFRLGWAIYISPDNMVLQQHFMLLLGCVELFRRFIGITLRVEWEFVVINSEIAVATRRLQRIRDRSRTLDSYYCPDDGDEVDYRLPQFLQQNPSDYPLKSSSRDVNKGVTYPLPPG